MNISIEELLAIDNLNDYSPKDSNSLIGTLFELGRESQDISLISKGIELSANLVTDIFSNDEKITYHYHLANGWSYKQRLSQSINSNEFWEFDMEELRNQIIHLRLAIQFFSYSNDDFKKCQIYTNLGNSLSHLGRFSEAQLYWNKALEIDNKFSMAIGNIGYGLFHYAKILYDEGHQFIFFQLTFKYLNQAIKSEEVYPEAKESFSEVVRQLITYFDKGELLDIQNFDNFSIGETKEEKEYNKWCLDNKLFLNPLNDATTQNICSSDTLLLPTMTSKSEKPLIYMSLFNQIKQEFVSARHSLYLGVFSKKNHHSDKNNLQIDLLDNSQYSFNIEQLKVAYRSCYSLFDKIGYLLNDYLNLGYDLSRVTFRSIWYEKKGKKITSVNKKIKGTQNWALRGLYWLSRDLYEKQNFITSLEPEAQELALIRNFIEHKSFKVTSSEFSGLTNDKFTYEINRQNFEKKALMLFKLMRSAIIYLSLAINIEERKKNTNDYSIIIEPKIIDDETKT